MGGCPGLQTDCTGGGPVQGPATRIRSVGLTESLLSPDRSTKASEGLLQVLGTTVIY